jgi:Dyp-type peroxidase family
LGVPTSTLGGFAQPFIEGLVTPHRSRLFGDVGASDPEHWAWGGPRTEPIDAVIVLYTTSDGALDELHAAEEAVWTSSGWVEVNAITCSAGTNREHFGFADGISQPAIEGYHQSESKFHLVKSGEFILGYPNEYDLYTSRPLVDASAPGSQLLPADIEGSSAADLGRNGTYVVMRQLRQDVVAFRSTLDRLTEHADGSSNPDARALLAAKLVGRWPSGAPLIKTPWKDEAALARENEFGYHTEDPNGLLCPVGSHVRRANPRDSLAPNPGTEDSMSVNRRHRLIRRGRAYGSELAPGAVDNGERGLMFVAINANIARQFEFVQHSWIADPRFNGFRGESDPITGTIEDNCFTQEQSPVRCRYTGLPRFVDVVGGAYFFMPGLRALRYLASLGQNTTATR